MKSIRHSYFTYYYYIFPDGNDSTDINDDDVIELLFGSKSTESLYLTSFVHKYFDL